MVLFLSPGGQVVHSIHAIDARPAGVSSHLDLKVKVLKEWQRDPKYLNRLGF